MRPKADLSLPGMALHVAEFVNRVGLTDVTVVQNDWGGADPYCARRHQTHRAPGHHLQRGIRQLSAPPGSGDLKRPPRPDNDA
jgi:hypothetical protein